jgi:hypothetical protein
MLNTAVSHADILEQLITDALLDHFAIQSQQSQ